MITMIYTYGIIVLIHLTSFTGTFGTGIVGGRVAKPHSRPYMASLQVEGHHQCGGILVREDFVLTAAHCPCCETTVVLGAHNISKEEKSQQRIKVAKFIQHENFTGGYDNDIMLLKLKHKAKLNKYVRVIGLPKKDGKIPANINCTVAGWGITGVSKLRSDVLRESTEKMQFSDECKHIWKDYFNTAHMLCTKFNKKMGGICQGDSGGPLLCNSIPQGITAYTYKDDCNNPKFPHVFTKVHPFLPWIKKTMQAMGNAV